MNRLQFLSLAHIITVRGCRSGAFSGIPDAYRHFLAGGEPDPRTDGPRPGDTSAMPPDFELAHPSLVSFLERLLRERLTWPVIGYELEADGLVAATAETAWPDCEVAVVGQELAGDRAAFERAGWRVFSFGPAGLTTEDTATIISILSSRT